MAVEQVGDGRPDGTNVFQSGEKGAFFGATPVVKPTSASQAAVTATVTTTATTTELAVDVAASIVLLNQVRSELVSLGLMVGS
jgi:hypothetical protein